mmetsp:Transcript_46884/g.110344  ORF Transcript_46884/g.110344 Transcript_46884/m.110344 type:complete len:1116 (-) Transcript_46884:3020-6367(-)
MSAEAARGLEHEGLEVACQLEEDPRCSHQRASHRNNRQPPELIALGRLDVLPALPEEVEGLEVDGLDRLGERPALERLAGDLGEVLENHVDRRRARDLELRPHHVVEDQPLGQHRHLGPDQVPVRGQNRVAEPPKLHLSLPLLHRRPVPIIDRRELDGHKRDVNDCVAERRRVEAREVLNQVLCQLGGDFADLLGRAAAFADERVGVRALNPARAADEGLAVDAGLQSQPPKDPQPLRRRLLPDRKHRVAFEHLGQQLALRVVQLVRAHQVPVHVDERSPAQLLHECWPRLDRLPVPPDLVHGLGALRRREVRKRGQHKPLEQRGLVQLLDAERAEEVGFRADEEAAVGDRALEVWGAGEALLALVANRGHELPRERLEDWHAAQRLERLVLEPACSVGLREERENCAALDGMQPERVCAVALAPPPHRRRQHPRDGVGELGGVGPRDDLADRRVQHRAPEPLEAGQHGVGLQLPHHALHLGHARLIAVDGREREDRERVGLAGLVGERDVGERVREVEGLVEGGAGGERAVGEEEAGPGSDEVEVVRADEAPERREPLERGQRRGVPAVGRHKLLPLPVPREHQVQVACEHLRREAPQRERREKVGVMEPPRQPFRAPQVHVAVPQRRQQLLLRVRCHEGLEREAEDVAACDGEEASAVEFAEAARAVRREVRQAELQCVAHEPHNFVRDLLRVPRVLTRDGGRAVVDQLGVLLKLLPDSLWRDLRDIVDAGRPEVVGEGARAREKREQVLEQDPKPLAGRRGPEDAALHLDELAGVGEIQLHLGQLREDRPQQHCPQWRGCVLEVGPQLVHVAEVLSAQRLRHVRQHAQVPIHHTGHQLPVPLQLLLAAWRAERASLRSVARCVWIRVGGGRPDQPPAESDFKPRVDVNWKARRSQRHGTKDLAVDGCQLRPLCSPASSRHRAHQGRNRREGHPSPGLVVQRKLAGLARSERVVYTPPVHLRHAAGGGERDNVHVDLRADRRRGPEDAHERELLPLSVPAHRPPSLAQRRRDGWLEACFEDQLHVVLAFAPRAHSHRLEILQKEQAVALYYLLASPLELLHVRDHHCARRPSRLLQARRVDGEPDDGSVELLLRIEAKDLERNKLVREPLRHV